MKKILVLLLIFVLSFSIMGCGGGNDDTTQPDGDNTPVAGEDENADSEDENAGDEDSNDEDLGSVNVEDLYMSEDEESGRALADIGLKAEKSFPLEGTLAKVDYSNLEKASETIEQMVLDSTREVFGEEYPTYKEYEVYEGDEIDYLAYAVGTEDNDSDKCYLEAGAYHNSADGKYYQYAIFTSHTYYAITAENIKAAIADVKDAYSVDVSAKKVEQMAEAVMEEAETMGFAAVYDEETIKGSGYTETVWFGVEAYWPEEGDGEPGFYLSVERERCYN